MTAVDLVKGKRIEQARNLNDGNVFSQLIDIPAKKHHCIQLAVKTPKKPLMNTKTVTGVLKEWNVNRFVPLRKIAAKMI